MDWKKKLSFPVNYSSDESGEQDTDSQDLVVMRPVNSSSYLLADGGDGSEADLLGTTPPREIVRGKRKKKLDSFLFRDLCSGRRTSSPSQVAPSAGSEFTKKHLIRKHHRKQARDLKVDLSDARSRADSLPSPNRTPAVPTLVESCNRFMSLTSRLKCRNAEEVETRRPPEEEGDACRVSFHKTFSLLINMGSMEKGCKRTISREEQVWQNELKDLIWLELQAKLGGRSLSEQDAFLCAQRNVVPTIVQKINDYRFVNPDPCLASRKLAPIDGSRDDLTADSEQANEKGVSNDDIMFGCLSFNCQRCTDAVGRAMREVSTLLDSFYNATTLYQSSKAMTAEHPLIATQLFQNRVKAMCLWYNSALYMRLKMLSVRCMLRSMRLKSQRRALSHAASTDSELSRQSSECRPCQVRFCSPAPDSSNSANSDAHDVSNNETSDSHEEVDEVKTTHEDNQFEHSAPPTPETSEPATPSIVIDAYTTDGESGYSSDPGEDDVYSLGVFEDVTRLRLLGKCAVSVYREYHREILKTQGVRRCMLFMNKMRLNVLHKVYETLVKPDSEKPTTNLPEVPVEVFDDTKEEEEKPRAADQGEVDQRKYELRRYGCWSEETLAMRLPSYRSHFLLLSSICMEAVHDYLSLRLEDRPNNPSCLTVKQLIHELKEGLDIAAEMRAAFAANVEVALSGHTAGAVARTELLLLIRTYDDTVETVFKQYLSYLRTMSEVEQLSRWSLQAEWSFAARLARRVKCAATLAPVTFSEIACNQLNRILVEFDKKFSELKNKEKRDEEVDNADARRQAVFAICRWAQGIYASSREGSLQTAQWARALAARLARAPLHVYTPQRTAIFESLMSLRDRIFQHTLYILERSKPSAAFVEDPRDQEAMAARVRELLLQVYKLGFEMHKELHRFANDSRPALGRRITGSPPKLASRVSFMRSESVGEDAETNVFDDKLFENIKGFCDNQSESSIELLLSGEPPPPTYGCVAGAEAGAGAEERRWAARVARAVVEFAQCWMQFVVERCDKGRGLRPRWASQGLEFLMLACDPCNTKHLTDKEFEELKKQMDGCISHVIGSRAPPRSDPHLASPDPMRRPRPRLSNTSSQASSPSPASREVPAPPTPPLEPEPLLNFHGFEPKAHTQRVLEAVTSLERGRNERLRAARCVGHVVETAASTYEPKLRQLKFKWQRGLKIGAGTFGKVYTVVNTESGQLLAMKELAVGANASDRHALQRAANELRVLEGVVHPHLVRYYGCELHREEMLLFMELCVEGSLEALVGTSGALPEPTVRRYARQLLSAVLELHTRAIVHRDIKSGNIFLTNEGHCLKLGDFGCAVKIRANTTAAGELQGYVGTQAYMAPEVFMQSSGHGRAADIWSLGCVVTEMASGKRPWSEYDSNYQIMFVVGMGRLPAIPASLSEEGRQFCRACLTHEPELRPRAKELMAHHFLMVKSDDDCKCEPAYLIT